MVPFNAGSQFSAVKISCRDLILEIESTPVSHDSAGSHFNAVVVIWRGAALMRDHDCAKIEGKQSDGETITAKNIITASAIACLRIILRVPARQCKEWNDTREA